MAGNVRFVPSGAALVAFVVGDVDDLTSRSIGRTLIDQAGDGSCRGLVIDLRSVTFLGSNGLSMLLDVRRTLMERHLEIHLLCEPNAMPMRVLQITRLEEVFPVHLALRDALAALDELPA